MLHDPLFFGVFVFAGRRGELLAPKNLRQRNVKGAEKSRGIKGIPRKQCGSSVFSRTR